MTLVSPWLGGKMGYRMTYRERSSARKELIAKAAKAAVVQSKKKPLYQAMQGVEEGNQVQSSKCGWLIGRRMLKSGLGLELG